MEKRNSFIESLKVDKATLERINAILRDAAKNSNVQTGKSKNSDDGGRERGDTGPGSLGRESGNKSGGISNGQSESSGEHGQLAKVLLVTALVMDMALMVDIALMVDMALVVDMALTVTED